MQNIISKFKILYKSEPSVFRAPGRINIIGEHTDYNNGFVLPTAINKEMYFAIAPNTDQKIRLFAYDLDERLEISLSDISIQKKYTWANYLLGVIHQLQKNDISIQGVDVVFGGTIPVGAGISSSAAIECGFLYALNGLFELKLDDLTITKFAQKAEHEYAGVNCGIMDQFAVVFSKEDTVIRLDCKTLEYEYVPLSLHDYKIILCNSNVSHNLASSEYNVRRNQCNVGVEFISQKYASVTSLRDVTLAMLEECKTLLTNVVYDRCLYVVEENNRVLAMCEALQKSDYAKIGELLYQSHEGLQYLYEVSCKELDELVAIARTVPGVLGARMMGGGFGGCTLQIVHNSGVDKFVATIQKEYYLKHNKQENIIIAELTKGVSKITF